MLTQRAASRMVQPPAWIQWCVDARQVTIIDRACAKAYVLSGLQAAVWNWFTLGYSCSRVIEMVSSAGSQSLPAADALVCSMISDWMANGLLEEKRNHDH